MLEKGQTPTKREILPPAEGWEERALYLVLVSYRQGNPAHLAYLQIGFLDKGGKPAGTTEIWLNSYDEPALLSEAYYLQALKKLHSPKTL